MMSNLKVWWVPQVPMDAFEVEVESVEQGVFLLDVLGRYDLFQYENRVKGDYCNMGGLLMLEDGEWVDWFDDATGEDDPAEFVRASTPTPNSTTLLSAVSAKGE